MKILLVTIIVLFGLIALSFIFIEALIMADAKGDPDPHGEYVIVLGAGLAGDQPRPILTERLRVALQYLHDHPQIPVVVSGGQGSDEQISEAEAMARVLEAGGISSERIIKEDRSTSTDENLFFSLQLIQQRGVVQHIVIITSEFHLYRAKLLAARYGLVAKGVPAKTQPLPLVRYLFREYFAVLVTWLQAVK